MKPWITLWRSTCLKFRYAYCLQSWSPAGTASWRKRLRSCMFAHTCTYPHIHKDLCGSVYVNLFLNEFYINLKNRFTLFYDMGHQYCVFRCRTMLIRIFHLAQVIFIVDMCSHFFLSHQESDIYFWGFDYHKQKLSK